MPIEVPAHLQYAAYVENNVQIEAGNNWDFSRTAQVTPIAVAPEPEPVVAPVEAPAPRFSVEDGVPEKGALAVIHFTDEGITIGREDQKALLALAKDVPLIVAAHGDAKESDANRLSRIRGKAVTTFLRSKGYTVSAVKAFGSTRPTQKDGPEENRIVAIYAAPDVTPF